MDPPRCPRTSLSCPWFASCLHVASSHRAAAPSLVGSGGKDGWCSWTFPNCFVLGAPCLPGPCPLLLVGALWAPIADGRVVASWLAPRLPRRTVARLGHASIPFRRARGAFRVGLRSAASLPLPWPPATSRRTAAPRAVRLRSCSRLQTTLCQPRRSRAREAPTAFDSGALLILT
eukprot:scaffold1353_cov363-Pavlova_lutheri.AAC.5